MTRTLWAASLRYLLRHPVQLALALAGLALGVATITAVDIATASSGRAFELSMQAVNGAATHTIDGGPAGIDEALYVRLRKSTDGIALAPVVEGYVVAGGETMQLVGIDPLVDASVRGAAALSAGAAEPESGAGALSFAAAWFTEPGTVMVSAETAARLGVQRGETFELGTAGRTHRARVIALLPDAGSGYGSLIVTDIAQAQEWLGLIGRLSRIDVRVEANASGERELQTLRAQLHDGLALRPAQLRTEQSLDMTAAFTTNLQAMSLLALLVGVFLIYSAVSFAVVQRRRVMGVLRALGATRAGVLTIVLTEAAVLGAVGSFIGVLLGTAIGRELVALVSRTINDLYFIVSVNEVVLPVSSLVKAVAAGVGVALAAAAVPALEAARSEPQLGMRRSVVETRAVRASTWLVGASVVFATAAGLIVWRSDRSLLAGIVALFLLLLSVTALTPATLRWLAQHSAAVAGRFSPIARLALGDIANSLSRTGVAVAALGLAVAAMIGVSVMVESFRESLREWLARTMRADVYVTAPGPGFGRPEQRLDPAVVASLLKVPSVADHSESRRVVAESPVGPVRLDALRLARGSTASIPLTEGNPQDVWAAFERGDVVISEPLAWRLRLGVGERLSLRTAGGWREFVVAGIYREYGNDQGNVLMDRDVYRRLWQDDAITSLGIYLHDTTSPQDAMAELRAATAGRQALFMASNAELRARSMRIFERTFVITRVLYWLTAGVAAIGLISSLLAWELERSRELALVRALGLTPRGAAALVETQSGFMGIAAFLAAVPAGVLTAVLLIEVINRRAFGWEIDLHLATTQFTNAFWLALAAALAGGLYPAWRAGRAPVADEIREE